MADKFLAALIDELVPLLADRLAEELACRMAEREKDPSQIVSATEVRKMARCGTHEVYRAIKCGELRAIRNGKMYECLMTDVRDWIKRRQQRGH